MENVQNTYINLFKLDRNGIGNMTIIAPENVDEAIAVWCQKAIECLNKPVLSAEEADFYYDFIEHFVKKRHVNHPDFIAFKTMYMQKIIAAINNNKFVDISSISQTSRIAQKHTTTAAYMEKHGCLSDMFAAEELILLLVNGPDFNNDRINVRFDTLESKKSLHTYSARNNELVIDHSLIYEDFNATRPMEYTLQRLYAVLCLVEKKNLENEMNHDITLNALMYTIEKNYRRAFKTKAFDLMISTPMIDYHTRENVCSYLYRSALYNPTLSNQTELTDLLVAVEEDLRDARHYTPSMLQTYGSNPVESNDAITTELATRSLISLRANPRSMPTEIKRLLFLDGELKTFYQLKRDLEELSTVRSVMTPEAYETAKSEKAKILDYLTTYCIPLKIERIVHLINTGDTSNEEYMNDLYDSLYQLKQDYPTEYETAISILRNRLNKLNSYCASTSKVSSYFDEIFSVKDDLTTIERVVTYPSPAKSGMSDVTLDPTKIDTKTKLHKIVYELQKLSGKGVEEILSTLLDGDKISLLHNVSPDLAKQYTSSKFIKKGITISK